MKKPENEKYYWICYQFPNESNKIWAIGKYDESTKWFYLCERIVVSLKYIIEIRDIQKPETEK